MRKNSTHRGKAVLARVMVVIMVLIYVTLIPDIPIQSASTPMLTMSSQKILIGDTYNLDIKNKVAKSIYQWSSSDTKIATVDEFGLVTGIKKGNAVITCTVKAPKATYKLHCNMKVIKPASVFRIKNKISVINIAQEYDVDGFLAPASSDDEVIWSSSDPSIATPDLQGKFIALKEGTVTITGKTLSGKKDSMTFKVLGKEGVVTTQEELELLLKSPVNVITIRTSQALDLTISRGNYADKKLIVEAPKADISNYGVFGSIDIKQIAKNSWYENAVGNLLNVLTDARIVVSPFAKVNINVDAEEAKLTVENYGTIDEFVVVKSSDIKISGNTRQDTPVVVNAPDITITSSVPLNLSCNQKIALVLLSGAEKSKIQAASSAVLPTIQSNSKFKVIVGEGINVIEQEVIPTPLVVFVPDPSTGGGTGGGTTPTSYHKTFIIDRPITEITAINASYAGKAYTITSTALELLISLLINDPTYVNLWKDISTHTQTYDGQTFSINGQEGSATKTVSFAGGQFDGRSYLVTVNTNCSVTVTSNMSNIAFTITKGSDDKSLTISGDYSRLSGLTFTIITGNTYILEKSYKELKAINITYAGETYAIDASLLTTLDFFLSKESIYLEVWQNTTNTTKTFNGQKVNVNGVAGSNTKTVTFLEGPLNGKAYTVTVNSDQSVTIISSASGLSFTVNKGTDERSLTITGAPQGLVFAPSFE